MLPYVWLGVIVAAIIIEALTVALVSVWFIPGAIIAMALAFFDMPLYLQIIAFAAASAVMLTCFKPIIKKTLKIKEEPTNVIDTVIGKQAIVTEKIDNLNEFGAVKIQGKEWSARSADGSEIDVGEVVNIIEIRGVKLICTK
ncbi:MAG: NfeD family protein [Clostridiales bacterium]|nr:NfeD family protein [Clostridiales bacterium]